MSIPKTSAWNWKIYLGSNLIAEGGCGEWKPWANTVAYYELNGDANDSSGNGYNWTPSNITYTTLTSWIKVATFNGSNSKIQIANPLINSLSNFTINVWISRNNTTFLWNVVNNQTSDYDWAFIDNYNWNLRVAVWWWSATNYSLNANTRVNVILTYASGSIKEYINGSYYWGETHTYSNWTNMTIWCRGNSNDRRWNWYISKVILENKARTADEISAYYNQTKAKYWIS